MDATSTLGRERFPAPVYRAPQARDALARLRGDHPPVRVQAPLDRARILDVTEACLDELGYDGTTIRQIAGRLDCAVGTIYRYFKDKRSLLTAVVQRRFEPVAQQIDAGVPMHRTAALYVHLASTAPQQYRLMFWLASVQTPGQVDVPQVVEQILAGWAGQLDDHRAAERFWAQVHGGLMLGLSPQIAIGQTDAPEPVLQAPAPPAPVAQAVLAAVPADDDDEDLTLL